jgi:hypothetical protein
MWEVYGFKGDQDIADFLLHGNQFNASVQRFFNALDIMGHGGFFLQKLYIIHDQLFHFVSDFFSRMIQSKIFKLLGTSIFKC